MKKIIILLCITFSGICFAQGTHDTSVFHRLIIYNADNEIMLVKIKDTDVWVTPGFYQDSIQFIKEGLHDIASTYGMKISNPELKGTFSMRREIGETKEMLIRNIYSSNYLSGEIHFPENQSFEIGEIKWLPIKETLSLIPFESVRMFIKQTHEYPNFVWGGSINALRKDNTWEYKIMEEFYPLFSPQK
jgi:hypothetical protein